MASQESSVLFSLNQLMGLEEDRLREEGEAARRRAEAEAAALLERARRGQAEAAERARSEELRRAEEERLRREEQARVEAARAAAVEAARLEVERRAELELREQERRHELALSALAADESRRRLRRALLGVGALAAALLVGGVGSYLGHFAPEASRRAAAEALAVAERRADVERAGRALAEASERERQALADLGRARDDAERVRLAREQEARDRARDKERKAPGRSAPLPPPPTKPCRCENPMDPLCACLP